MISDIRQRASGLSRRIVYPGIADARLREAVRSIAGHGIARPVLVGVTDRMQVELRASGVGEDVELVGIDPLKANSYTRLLLDDLRSRGYRDSEIRETLREVVAYAVAMVRAGDADGLVLGQGSQENVSLGVLGGFNRDRSTIYRSFLVVLPPGGEKDAVLFVDSPGIGSPRQSQLADLAIHAATILRTLLRRAPRIAFLAPEVVAPLKRPGRFESAEMRLRARVREAIATAGARTGEWLIEPDLLDRFPTPGSGGGSSRQPDGYVFAGPQARSLGVRLENAFGGGGRRIVGPVVHGLGQRVGLWGPASTVEDIIDATAMTVLL